MTEPTDRSKLESKAFIEWIEVHGEMSDEGQYTSDQMSVAGGRSVTEYIVDLLAAARREERNKILDLFEREGPGSHRRLIIQLREPND